MAQPLTTEQALFCRREHPRLVGAVTLYLGDRDVAEDIAQEALARACAAWGRVRRMRAPGAWVHRVAASGGPSRPGGQAIDSGLPSPRPPAQVQA